MLGRNVGDIAARHTPDYPFAQVRTLLAGQLTIGNLESPLTDRTAPLRPGPYRLPALDVEGSMYYTNKAPLSSYRGAGRPECVFAMDRIIDVAAVELNLDPADLPALKEITVVPGP